MITIKWILDFSCKRVVDSFRRIALGSITAGWGILNDSNTLRRRHDDLHRFCRIALWWERGYSRHFSSIRAGLEYILKHAGAIEYECCQESCKWQERHCFDDGLLHYELGECDADAITDSFHSETTHIPPKAQTHLCASSAFCVKKTPYSSHNPRTKFSLSLNHNLLLFDCMILPWLNSPANNTWLKALTATSL